MTTAGVNPATSLTFDAAGWVLAESQLSWAADLLGDLLLSVRQGLDSPGELKDRVRELNEVLVAAVAAVDRPGVSDRPAGCVECDCVAHVSPPVVGLSTPTVGAPVASPLEDDATGT